MSLPEQVVIWRVVAFRQRASVGPAARRATGASPPRPAERAGAAVDGAGLGPQPLGRLCRLFPAWLAGAAGGTDRCAATAASSSARSATLTWPTGKGSASSIALRATSQEALARRWAATPPLLRPTLIARPSTGCGTRPRWPTLSIVFR